MITPAPYVIVAEDSRTQAAWIGYILSRHGYRVAVASDGAKALALVREEVPDLVISDIMMPHMDGYELCRALKADRATEDVQVMLATSLKEPRDVIHGLAAGADNFLTKPLDEDTLIARVRHILSWREIDSVARPSERTVVTFDNTWWDIDSDSKRSIHFLLSAIRETDKQNRKLERAQRETEQALERVSELEAGLRDLIDNGAEPICIVSADEIRYVNRAAASLFGQSGESLAASTFPFPLDKAVDEVRVVRPDGTERVCGMRVSVINWQGRPASLASFWDVTVDVRARDELRWLSTADELTGLLNRRGFFAAAGREVDRMGEVEPNGPGVAVLFVDIDGMKTINDEHGHDAGDEALRTVGSVLSESCRDNDILARLGGDEFVVMLVDCDSVDQAEISERVHRTLLARHDEERGFELRVSIGGVWMAPGEATTLDRLMRAADARMYEMKQHHHRGGRRRAPVARVDETRPRHSQDANDDSE